MPVVVALLAGLYNTWNGYLQGQWLSHFGHYPNAWVSEPCFLAGFAVFLGGMAVNITSDNSLRRLRTDPSSEYKIPQGGLFEFISCPNYFGEIVEWCGWAIATWSQSGLAFAVFTFANLVPRAISHHRWYNSKFENYPRTRCAVIPCLL
ncbi:SRD5A1 [Klebsormidium nitens]|uniref:SRD5A1 n=1 Tax=Klebsormidium nitens TaxID=105231 RepID=A0A1Y1IDL9_KLENI|nr:SRD5A1 [Klebsormidium nitens]|eukprot:GAQ87529.1 SRD5A1 [Klebsormidium nitens]